MTMRSETEKGCSDVLIAILDGPVDLTHRCFDGVGLSQPSQFSPSPQADCSATIHGTHVASIIFGQENSSVHGLAPRCSGVSLPVFGTDKQNRLTCSQTDLARSIAAAVEYGAMVVNISGGQLDFSQEPESLLEGALELCENHNVLVVAAAGNDGCDCPHTPASYPTVLAVGAADSDGMPVGMSNWCEAYRQHGLLAPGKDIVGAVPGGGVARRTGTSFATPIVSAYAALLLCHQLANEGKANPRAVRQALLDGAKKSPALPGNERLLAGTVDLAGAKKVLKQRRTVMTETQNSSLMLETADSENLIAASGDTERHEQAAATTARAADEASAGTPSQASQASVGLVEAACGDGPCTCKSGNSSSCGCGGDARTSEVAPQKVYALGSLGFDFGSESRRDSICQYIPVEPASLTASQLISYLSDDGAEEIERLIWTLNIDSTPVYAIQPAGAFAFAGYEKILKLFERQVQQGISRVAIPGMLGGRVRLMSGETVPIIVARPKGIMPWDVDDVAVRWLQREKDEKKSARKSSSGRGDSDEPLKRFLNDFISLTTRKYRNLGIASAERALNFASTDIFRAFDAIDQIEGFDLVLDDLQVKRSAVCRPGAECFDVNLRLFKSSDIKAAIQVLQWTVDVSDSVPVSIGAVSTWSERPRG